jgi:hypothetical protein
MFTTLTIFAAWFSFGYTAIDLIVTIAKNNAAGNYND